MTNTFWIAATGLILLALAFILYPVLFHRPEARARARPCGTRICWPTVPG